MRFTRRTLRTSVPFVGLGLHTGEPVTVTVRPGDQGIAFRVGGERTPARPENVTDTTRSTKLGSVGTIEHLMSAFAGLEITDAEVEVEGVELPAMDGSAKPYVEGLVAAGFEDLSEVELPSLYKRIYLQEDRIKIAIAKGDGHWRYEYGTDTRWPHLQTYETADAPRDYAAEIAPARTFELAERVPAILAAGLAKGLDETSALILDAEGYQNEPRFFDEPARHKLLDLLGDLYLAGVPARFLSVVAERSGHRANVKAAAQLALALAD